MGSEEALYNLLCELFGTDTAHLRRFVAFGAGGQEFAVSLPAGQASMAELADVVVAGLNTRGIVAQALARLCVDFPHRRPAIERVAGLWSIELPPPGPSRSVAIEASPRPSRRLLLLAGALLLGVAGAAAVVMILPDDPPAEPRKDETPARVVEPKPVAIAPQPADTTTTTTAAVAPGATIGPRPDDVPTPSIPTTSPPPGPGRCLAGITDRLATHLGAGQGVRTSVRFLVDRAGEATTRESLPDVLKDRLRSFAIDPSLRPARTCYAVIEVFK